MCVLLPRAPRRLATGLPGDPQRKPAASGPPPALTLRSPNWRNAIPPGTGPGQRLRLPPRHAPGGSAQSSTTGGAVLLEEQLATDVDETHFALLHRQRERCAVAAIARQKMAAWLARCDELRLHILALTPDVLTLPCLPDRWSAVQADDQWLIRRDAGAGWR